jgi:bacteriorhodopsin
MNNDQVDIIMIVCFILGIILGLTLYNYGYYIYNFIFYTFVIMGLFFCIYTFYKN